MKSFLPILTPGSSEPVRVPCRLAESFDFAVFIPSLGGIRKFTAYLSSHDPVRAEIDNAQAHDADVYSHGLADAERDAVYSAAGDVLQAWLNRLGINLQTSTPIAHPAGTPHALLLHGIAHTFRAEVAAADAATSTMRVLPRALHSLVLITGRPDDGGYSVAVPMLEKYVDHCLEEVCKAQQEKAEKQRAEYTPPRGNDEDEPGSERVRNARGLDAATLKCLDVDY